MSAIMIGFASPDLTGTVGSRPSVTTDPDAFAAQLQSATESGTPVAAPETDAPAPTATSSTSSSVMDPATDPVLAFPTASVPTSTPDAPLVPTSPPVSFGQSTATPPTPTVAAAQLPATVPVVRPDADNSQSAATSTAQGTAPSGSDGANPDVTTSVARPVDPAAPLAPSPGPVRRGPRHASTGDAFPPIAALPAAQPLMAAVAATPAPTLSTAQLPDSGPVADEAIASAGAAPIAARAALPGRTPGITTITTTEAENGTSSPPQLPQLPTLSTISNAPPVSARSAVGVPPRPAVRLVTAGDAPVFATPPAQPSVSQAAAVSVPAPAQAAALPLPLNAQLAPPILALRTAGTGTHVLTLTVSPEAVGPVTVRAHVTGGLMRIELSAPTDQGTDALQSMLSDLKRDLSQGGLNSALTIATPDSGSAATGNQSAFGGAGGFFAGDDRRSNLRAAEAVPASVAAVSSLSLTRVTATTALDVLA